LAVLYHQQNRLDDAEPLYLASLDGRHEFEAMQPPGKD